MFTQMFWWTTLLYTVPVTEKELLAKCDVVVVYIRDGVFGELEPIRGPAQQSHLEATSVTTPETGMQKVQDLNANQTDIKMTTFNQSEPLHSSITRSTSETEPTMNDRLVITENAANPEAGDNDKPTQQPTASKSLPTTDVVIPESVGSEEGTHPMKEQVHEQERPQPLLPSNGVFLSKTYTIPLIRCDFEQIKQTVELRATMTNTEQTGMDNLASKDKDNTTCPNTVGTCTETNQTEARTSTRKRTVIDYKKFLEDYADESPSPPKRKREVDLK